MRVAILTYNVPHRKTYDTLCLLKAKGYKEVVVYAQKMTYQKTKFPLISHRPENLIGIPEPIELCKNFEYEYKECTFSKIQEAITTPFLLCGSGLLEEDFVLNHRIVNSHPGFIPLARGLDSFKWEIFYDLPIGVTTHFLGEYIDAGEIIERREIELKRWDTFHLVAQRVYEYEIEMLVHALDLLDEEHKYIIPEEKAIFKRMPQEIELKLFKRFEDRVKKIT